MATTVALETLGCKINQFESSHFLEILEGAGYRLVSFRDPADIYIVHSCSVTGSAAYQSRQLLRRAQRIQPQARIVLAGCNAHVEQERMVSERLATHLLGNMEKHSLLEWIARPGSLSNPCRAVDDPRGRPRLPLEPLPVHRMHLGRTRAFLKIQDGCDAFCSYCVVPHTRGGSRSLPAVEVRAQLDRFLALGYSEVVLTGIHLGQWGNDLTPRQSLAGLLEWIGEGPLPARLRLSSIEPMEWTEKLLAVLSREPRICPHFHVPLQHGDPEILSAMGRPYTPAQYRDLVHAIRLRFPDAAIGADVMVGFPGETPRHFHNTFELIRDLPLTYLHVFPFSPRPGTEAAGLPGRAAGNELRRRGKALRDLGLEKREAFERACVGRDMDVLVETETPPGWCEGISANYIKVRFPSPGVASPLGIVRVAIQERTANGMAGRMLR